MNATEVANTPQPPAAESEQHPLPESSPTPQDEPQSPAISHQDPDGTATETVLEIEPNEQNSDDAKAQDTKEETRQAGSESVPIEKVVIFAVTGVLSLFTIAMAYAASLSYSVRDNPAGPLTVSVILTVFNIIAFSWICGKKYRVTTTGALLPILFSFIGGLMVILYFAVAEAAKHRMVIHIDIVAVLVSVAVFGGIGFGASMGYLAFARN